MASLDVADRPDTSPSLPRPASTSQGRGAVGLLGGVLVATFVVAVVVRLLAHDVVITADEDNWMRR